MVKDRNNLLVNIATIFVSINRLIRNMFQNILLPQAYQSAVKVLSSNRCIPRGHRDMFYRSPYRVIQQSIKNSQPNQQPDGTLRILLNI